MTGEELYKSIVKILDDKKAEDVKVIKTAEHTIISDYFIVGNPRRGCPVQSRTGGYS